MTTVPSQTYSSTTDTLWETCADCVSQHHLLTSSAKMADISATQTHWHSILHQKYEMTFSRLVTEMPLVSSRYPASEFMEHKTIVYTLTLLKATKQSILWMILNQHLADSFLFASETKQFLYFRNSGQDICLSLAVSSARHATKAVRTDSDGPP